MVNPFLGQKGYVDSSVFIYASEVPHLFPNLRSLLIETMARGELTISTSWITLSEVLVKPLQVDDQALATAHKQLLVPTKYVEMLSVS